MGEERDELRLRSCWHFLSVSSFVSEREGERERVSILVRKKQLAMRIAHNYNVGSKEAEAGEGWWPGLGYAVRAFPQKDSNQPQQTGAEGQELEQKSLIEGD